MRVRNEFDCTQHKFSRDDEQILALNYENLCDGDYLHRLFQIDNEILQKTDDSSSMVVDQNRSTSENSLSNLEFAEDIIIFGESITLGQILIDRRFEKEVYAQIKVQDSLALQINRQATIFEHMSNIIMRKCLASRSICHGKSDQAKHIQKVSKASGSKSIIHFTLCTIFSLFRDKKPSSSSVKALLVTMTRFFDFSDPDFLISLNHEYFDELRKMFIGIVSHLSTEDLMDLSSWNKSLYMESIQVALYSVYGLLAFGILTSEISDIILALNFLLTIIFEVEMKSEKFLLALKDTVPQSTNSVPIKAPSSSNPPVNKLSLKSKQSVKGQKSSQATSLTGHTNNVPAVDNSFVQDEETVRVDLQEINSSNSSTTEVVSHSIKSAKPSSKLPEKTSVNSKVLEPQRESKTKLQISKPIKGEPKLLLEYLEKEGIAINPQSNTIVSNHVLVTYDNAPDSPGLKSKGGNNNKDLRVSKLEKTSPNSKNSSSEQGSNLMFTPRANLRHIEKEIKEANQDAFRVPNAILVMLNEYSKLLSKESTKVSSSQTQNNSGNNSKNNKPFLAKVWSCGQNSYGELGLGDVTMRKTFSHISALDDKKITSIGAGNEHSLFVTKDGKLYTAGYNDNGQCGIGTTQQVRQPTLVQTIEDEEIQQVFVFNGCEHTIALTREGKVFSFGYNYRGQLGLGSTASEPVPRPIRALLSRKVVFAACSYHHSIFLCSDGSMFACGRNDSGQLGHGDTIDKKTPQAVLSAPRHVVSLSCGQFHTAVSTAQGSVYVCGKNDYGQLGIDNAINIKVLSRITVPTELDNVLQVCCGYYHTLLLSSNGVVAGFGRNDYGQIGLGHTQPKVFQCTLITHLRDKCVTTLAAGCYHSIAVTANSMLYVFGRNNHGQLATGDLEERHVPHPVDDFVGQRIVTVAAGFYHTLVLTADSAATEQHARVSAKFLESKAEGIFETTDFKQLANLLQKDLNLLEGEINSLGNDALSLLSSSSSRDLLTILIKNISSFSSHDRFIGLENVEMPISSPELVSNTLDSLGSLLMTTWKVFTGRQSRSCLTIAAEDLVNFMCKLLGTCSIVLRRHKQLILSQLSMFTHVNIGFGDEEVNNDSIISRFMDEISGKASNNAVVSEELVGKAIERLRGTLLQVYFAINSADLIQGDTESFSGQLCELLIEEYDILFSHPFIALKLIVFLKQNLKSFTDPTAESESMSYMQLMHSIGKVFHIPDQPQKLFDSSLTIGIEIFSEIYDLYSCYSRYNVEKRLDPQYAAVANIDVKKLVTVLEQTICALMKVGLPQILSFVGENERMKTLVNDLTRRFINDAGELLDIVSKVPLSEENLSLLRYGTLLPSILPTFLLYAMASIKHGHAVGDIVSPLHSLVAQLEQVCSWELSCLGSKIINERKASELSINNSPMPMQSDLLKDEDMSDSLLEEILYVKKDQSQVSWWFRLLKLAMTLLSRINIGIKLFDPFSSSESEEIEVLKETPQVSDFVNHRIWNFLYIDEKDLNDRTSTKFLADLYNGSDELPPASEKAVLACANQRDKKKTGDAVYRMLSQSSQSSPSGAVFHAIEERLFDTVKRQQISWISSEISDEKLFQGISKIIKFIYSKRSILVSNTDGQSWIEILLFIERIFFETCGVLDRCENAYINLRPLPLPRSPSVSGKRWRRVIMVIICANRWLRARSAKVKSISSDVLDFIFNISSLATSKFTEISSAHVVAQRISSIYKALQVSSTRCEIMANSLFGASSALSSCVFISLKSDIVISTIQMLQKIQADDKFPLIGDTPACLSFGIIHGLKLAADSLERVVTESIKSYIAPDVSMALIDLQFLVNSIRLLELLHILHIGSRRVSSPSLSFQLCSELIIKLYEKYRILSNGSEEKTAARSKGSTFRERSLASKRAAFAILSYMQTVSIRSLSHLDICSPSFFNQAITAYNCLLSYLQNCRIDESLSSDEDIVGSISTERDSLGHLSNDLSGLNLLPVAASTLGLGRQNKEANKKRCQDLIQKPMEFSRNCEGVVVAGEKLLNNCKGTDFSIATWILVTCHTTRSKANFILGRLSHNEAWPMVLLRNDGKIEIMYGHNNEFEHLVSESVISTFTWTHISIIVEQKKIKLFINGVLDCQINTSKGNSRAVLFPLVIGSCPAQVQTRVNNVKDGFDGLMAQFKYYSRALSPIHVKVIFDHGPPETTDVSAKMIYHILASLKCMISVTNLKSLMDCASKCLDLCYFIFSTDINRRNRYAALNMIKLILSKDIVHQMTLFHVSLRTPSPPLFDRIQQVSLTSCRFLPPGLNFHESFVLYVFRIIGLNWLQYMRPSEVPALGMDQTEDAAESNNILEELVMYIPRSAFSKSVLDKLAPSSRSPTPNNGSSINERLGAQEEPFGETSYQLVHLLLFLGKSSQLWMTTLTKAINTAFERLSSRFISEAKLTKVDMLEVIAATFMLSGPCGGGYLGAEVENFFDDTHGKLIQINNTINGATVLSANVTNKAQVLKATKVRLNDLSYEDEIRNDVCASLIASCKDNLMMLLEYLSPTIKLLSRDFIATKAASSFQQKSLLRCLRPVETFVFCRLLSATVMYAPATAALLQELSQYPLLNEMINEVSCCVLETDRDDKEDSTTTMVRNCSSLAYHWFLSMKYISLVPENFVISSFPSDQEERLLIDFLSKQQGFQDDVKTIGRQISTGGLLVKSLLATVPSLIESFDISGYETNFLLTEKPASQGKHQSIAPTSSLETALSELDCMQSWNMMQYLRFKIIKSCRDIVAMVSPDASLSSPVCDKYRDILSMWKVLAAQTIHGKCWVDTSSLHKVLETSSLGHRIEKIISERNPAIITQFLSAAVKFSSTSMLLPTVYRTKQNVLLGTDYFPTLVNNLYLWLEISVGKNKLGDVAQVTLSELIPCILNCENEDLKMAVLQVCVYFIRRVAIQVLNGWKPSREFLDMTRNVHFNSLRTMAMDQVIKFKDHNLSNITHYAYNLTQLVVGLELVQRRIFVFEHQAAMRALSGNSKLQLNIAMAKVQSTVTAAPKLMTVRSNRIELDLTSCAYSVTELHNVDLVLQGLDPIAILPENVVVEVALGVGSASQDCIFEAVFCGANTRLTQAGLMPDSSYQLKCRAYIGAVPLSWSPLLEFRTDKGPLFTFDPLKSGPDIIISEDGMIATYGGDDSWSTLLGSKSFSSGVTSWEIKVNQTSTAYLFVGVATSAADLSSFLGGCAHGWGFIGEQAVYHNREKVKVYGDTFTTGDVVGVTLDLNQGYLSFTKNKKSLGIAFEKICGDLFPAVAFYNLGQELKIMTESFASTCAHEPLPISPTRLSMDDISLLNELVLSLYSKAPLSHRLAVSVAEHCNQWCTKAFVRFKTISKKDVFLLIDSPLLKRFALIVGERVRTFYGIAEVAGVAYNRVWFKVNPAGEVWFFTNQQIVDGKAKNLFTRCSYNNGDAASESNKAGDAIYTITFDAATVLDMMDPGKWSLEMDSILINFILQQSEVLGVEPWKITSDQLFDSFRSLQQQLGRVVLASAELTHRWGISGPKRKAVVARLGMLRLLNQMLDMYLPFFISDRSSSLFEPNKPSLASSVADDFVPIVENFTLELSPGSAGGQDALAAAPAPAPAQSLQDESVSAWPPVHYSWNAASAEVSAVQELWRGPLNALRRLIFPQLKLNHFSEVIRRTATRAAKTDDDYDYPENLPHVKINRLKSFRARESADLLDIPGDDLMLSTMFCQLWRELKQYNAEKLRISYTHPMDDGQSRTFKIKFEGEGVDDYGGPYREIFQQICTELHLIDPLGATRSPSEVVEEKSFDALNSSMNSAVTMPLGNLDEGPSEGPSLRCFLPLLIPTPNWVSDLECAEKYRFMFHPAAVSSMKRELFEFMGCLVGIAVRSKITLDFSFPSFIWKAIVGERLTEADLASFDMPAYDLVKKLAVLHHQHKQTQNSTAGATLSPRAIEEPAPADPETGSHEAPADFSAANMNAADCQELNADALQDLTWSVTRSDGAIIDLIPNGRNTSVRIEDLGRFLNMFVDTRFEENKVAIQLFRRGLVSIIPESSISLLTWEEIESIVCGSRTIDIERLRENTEYDDDVSPEDEYIGFFWDVLRSFNELEKSAFLKFVWARPSLPPKGVDFTQKMRVLSAGAADGTLQHDTFLPKAHTCFFSINLPRYSSREIMEEKLRYAIVNCTEMDGDFRTTDLDVPGWGTDLSGLDLSTSLLSDV